jgi:hypothetical protein
MYDIILFGDMPDLQTYGRATGCHRLATELREHGYTVLVIDFSSYINLDRFKKITNLAVGDNTLFVGFSTQWFPFKMEPGKYSISEPSKPHNKYQGPEASEDSIPIYFGKEIPEVLFDHIRAINPKTKIAIGGFKVYMYTHIKGVDNFFVGYSDTMIIDYANSLSGCGPKRVFNSIIDYDKKAQNTDWDFRKSKISYVDESFILPSETLTLEVGRGCRFNCKFCSFPLIGQKNINDYLKHEECLYHELMDNYNKFGTHKYMIVDDTFNDSTEKLEMVNRVVARLPFKPVFWCYMRLDLITVHPEHITLAKSIGIRTVYFGIETLSKRAGAGIGKGMPASKITATLEKCREVWGDSVWIMGGLICGLPHDAIAEFESSCSYFDRDDSPVDHLNVTPLRIFRQDEHMKNRFNSDFEINAEKYGYTWPHDDAWRWVKIDTDIDSYDTACALAVKWQERLDKHIKFFRFHFHTSCLLGDEFNYESLMTIKSHAEWREKFGDLDIVEAMHQQIEKEYFIPLLNFLITRKGH